LVGVAVNVTEVPAQVGLVPDVMAIATLGMRVAFTVIVIPVDVAVVVLPQEELDVITQVTICPLVKVDDV